MSPADFMKEGTENMITFERFSQMVVERLKELAEGRFQVQIDEMMKNNGVKRVGITAVRENCSISPVIYLDKFYAAYKCCDCTIDEAVQSVYELLKIHTEKVPVKINAHDLLNWDKIKPHIFARLINAEWNRELLEKVPHKRVMDLAEVYYVKAAGKNENDGIGSILIYHEHGKMWDVGQADLHEAACNNMATEKSAFVSMEEIIGELTGNLIPGSCGMYVLTNGDRIYGASEILKEDTLCGIAEQMQDDFIILPSSVHEVIVIPDKDDEYAGLAEMVREINATQLAPDEILSNHVYRYDRTRKELSIAA